MMKSKRLKKPKLSVDIKKPFKRTPSAEEKVSEALSNVPRITNDTLSEHREEVLSSARKYIYPLQHSKHRIVRISIGLLVTALIVFLVGIGLSLYKFQNTSGFVYDVTRILPLPVAKTGSHFVSYESYLFELRRNMHYYQTQQQANFKTKDGKAQLTRLKQQALNQVVEDAYVKQLASQNHITVSDQAVDAQVNLLKSQNRLGSSDRVFREVLSEFWGWNTDDFKRKLKQQMLAQAVMNKLDTGTHARAEGALAQLKSGADFAKLAAQISDDIPSRAAGGNYPVALDPNDHDIPPALTAAVFKLKPNQISDIINTGYTLEIVKVLDSNGKSVHAAHIQFNFQDINSYLKPLRASRPVHQYIQV